MPKPQEAKADGVSWYNASWLYRKPIIVDNTSGTSTLTNYQVKVSVTYDSHMQSDFDDIRFTDSNGAALLDHWRETFTTSTSATFWVVVPSIATSSTSTIYMYYGNDSISSVSNGSETFEERGFDNFELFNTGSLAGQAVAVDPWTEYAGNPVLSPDTGTLLFPGSALKVGSTYHLYYTYYQTTGGLRGKVGHATSSDGINWTKDTANNPMLEAGTATWENSSVLCPTVWKEGDIWYMLYAGRGTVQEAIGLATSSDGIHWTKSASNPVLTGSETWEGNSIEVTGIIKVGSTYYTWYESDRSGERQTGLATSINLTSWTKDVNNPIYIGGRFCPDIFKYGDYYYMVVPHYTSGTDYSQLELYRDTSPTFYPASREFVKVAINLGASGEWNDYDQDTPWVLTDDVYRNSFNASNGELWVYFAGSPDGSLWYGGMTIETDITTALEKVNEPPLWTRNKDTITVVDTPTRQGARAIKQSDTSSTSSFQFYTSSFNSKTTGAIGAWMRRNNTTGGGFDIYIYSGATVATAAGLGTTYFHYHSAGSFHNTAVTYSANNWYLVILEFNTVTDKYNFVVYDTDLNEIVRQDNISFSNASGAIDQIKFNTDSALVVDGYIDDFRLRQYSSPEPLASLGAETAIPTPPTIGIPTVLSSIAIRWNFTDNADNETGFRVYTNADAMATSSATADLTYLDETGISENTQYTRYVKAYNSYGESASSLATSTYTLVDTPTNLVLTAQSTTQIDSSVDTFPNHSSGQSAYYFANTTASTNSGWQTGDNTWSETTLSPNTQYTYTVKYRNGDGVGTTTATSSKYTLAPTPTGLTSTNITSQSITVSADTLPNVAAGSSGYYFANTTKGTNSGWIKTNSWQDTNLTCPTTYTYSVIYRNGDAVETASTTKVLTTSGCSGYTPPITTSAPIIIVSTTTVIVTSTLIVTTTISQAEPVKQAAAQQLQTQIADVKQQIIAWLTQLIQIIQEQIKQLQAQLQQLQAQ